MTIAICLSIVPILATWSLAESYGNNVGGLLPIFDSGAYYNGAEHILDTGKLDSWNERRPLTAIFLSVRLLVTNFDFRSTLLLQAMILGISAFFVALAISRTFGKCAGFVMFIVLFALSSIYLPQNLSESTGFIFGCLSFSLAWLGIFEHNLLSYLSSLFFLTIGFMVRPGPFLLFPALMLFAGFFFSGEKRFNWINFVLSFFPIGFGMFFNQCLIWLYGEGNGLLLGNYATTFYGLAAGGKGWQQYLIDFPYESRNYSEGQLYSFLYKKSLELIYTNPLRFITTIFSGYITEPIHLINQLYQILTEYSNNSMINHYGFLLFSIILICVLFGIFRFFLYSKLKSIKYLFLIFIVTTFLSLPFFFQDGGIRTLVIIFPYFAISIVIGIFGWRSRSDIQKNYNYDESPSLYAFIVPFFIGSLILTSVFLTPAIGPLLKEKLLDHPISKSLPTCTPNETFFLMRVDRGIPFLEMMDEKDIRHSFAPYVHPSDFSSPLERYYLNYYYDLTDFIDGKDSPVLFWGYALNYQQSMLILAPRGLLTSEHQTIQFCGISNNITKEQYYWVYELNSSSMIK
jgi:hypothetical protein